MTLNNRLLLFFVFLFVFVLFLAGMGVFVWYIITHPDTVDTSMAVWAGVGGGLVLEFFLAMLTLAWQFYWRKTSSEEKQVAEKSSQTKEINS